jgi:ATP-dependent Lon protease
MDSTGVLENQIQNLEEKAKTASLPPELMEKIKEELALLRSSLKAGPSTVNIFPVFESISNYINWVASLPFNKETKDALDLTNAKQILDKNHYGLSDVKNRILEYMSSLILNSQENKNQVLRAPILCLIGLVGTGKTTLAYSIAEAMGRKYARIPLGGAEGAHALRGQSRAVPDAEPGLVIKSLVHAQSKNSVILLDELDRIPQTTRSDIMGVLVELLDPEQNMAFTDHYIDFPFDLSHVLFVATANNTTNIATAVLDRLEVLQLPSYSDEEKTVIGKKYIFPKIRKQTGLSENQVAIADDVWPQIIRPLGFDSGMRSLERALEAICQKIAMLIVEKKVQKDSPVNITNENVKEFLPA